MSLPPHLSRIAAEEARKKNVSRSLSLSRLGAINERRRPVAENHSRFRAWVFSQKG